MEQDLVSFLKSVDLFEGFSDENLTLLLPYIHAEQFEKGEWLLKEGEEGEDLYIIKSGEAEVLKGEKQDLQIAVLEAGDVMGEMSFLEKQKRSASVRAVKATEVLILSPKALSALPVNQTQVLTRLAKRMSERLRGVDERLFLFLKEKWQLIRMQDEVGKTIVQLSIFMALYLNVTKVFGVFGSSRVSSLNAVFYPVTLLFLGVLSLWFINASRSPFSFYGLTVKNWKWDVLEAVVLSIPILAFLVILKWALISFVPLFGGLTLFTFVPQDESVKDYVLQTTGYLLLIPVQEVIARGFLQTSFRNFFQGRHRTFTAILSSNLLFNIFHTVESLWFAFVIFGYGIFWGYLYERQKSIVGCTVSHILAGALAFFVLNYDAILSMTIGQK